MTFDTRAPLAIQASRTINVGRGSGGIPIMLWRNNEPAGMSELPPLDFNNPVEQTPWSNNPQPNLQYLSDGESPSDGINIGRLVYPSGFNGGSATVSMGYNDPTPANKKEIYACIGIKIPSNFQYHETGTNKLIFMTVSGFGGGGDPFFALIDSRVSPPRFRAVLQGSLPRTLGENINAVDLTANEWHVIEFYAKMNTPEIGDGIYRQWVNNILTTDFDDVEFVDSTYAFNIPRLENTWGGSGGIVADEFYLDVSEFFVSYKVD